VLVKQLECDVFVTGDRGFEHEHDLCKHRLHIAYGMLNVWHS
jgi:hypothetical protein